jgi:hypothetical protein
MMNQTGVELDTGPPNKKIKMNMTGGNSATRDLNMGASGVNGYATQISETNGNIFLLL